MKNIFLSFLFLLFTTALFAQQKDSVNFKKPSSSIGFCLGATYTYPSGKATESGISNIYTINFDKKLFSPISFGVDFNHENLTNKTYFNISDTTSERIQYFYKIRSLSIRLNYDISLSKRFFFRMGIGTKFSSVYKNYNVGMVISKNFIHYGVQELYGDNYWSFTLSPKFYYYLSKSISIQSGINKNFALTPIRPYHPYYDWYKLKLNYLSIVIGLNYHF
jgi:hypothetical protein